jgi:hypothetical protein
MSHRTYLFINDDAYECEFICMANVPWDVPIAPLILVYIGCQMRENMPKMIIHRFKLKVCNTFSICSRTVSRQITISVQIFILFHKVNQCNFKTARIKSFVSPLSLCTISFSGLSQLFYITYKLSNNLV